MQAEPLLQLPPRMSTADAMLGHAFQLAKGSSSAEEDPLFVNVHVHLDIEPQAPDGPPSDFAYGHQVHASIASVPTFRLKCHPNVKESLLLMVADHHGKSHVLQGQTRCDALRRAAVSHKRCTEGHHLPCLRVSCS